MFFVKSHERREASCDQADELPRAHAAVRQRAAELPRPAAALRGVVARSTATSAAGRCTGCLRVKHITQDDAHVFVTRGPDPGGDGRDGRLRPVPLRPLRADRERRALDATRQQLGTDEQWDRAEAALVAALKRHGMDYFVSPGEGTFYGPKIDLHMTDVLGRSWQIGTIQLDDQMPARFGLDLHRAPTTRSTTGVRDPPCLLRLARTLHRDPDRALRRGVPLLARAGADPDHPGGRGPPRAGRAR